MRSRLSAFILPLAIAASQAFAADVAMVNLLMPDAKVIGGVDVERARNSPFGQYVLRQMAAQEGNLGKFIEATGFDPRRDLYEVVVASTDAGALAASGTGSVLVLRGAFNPAKIMQLAGTHSGLVTSYNGTQVIQTAASGQKETVWAGFLGNLLVAGPQAGVKGAIDRYRAAGAAEKTLAARVQSASSKYDAWFVTTISPAALAGNLNNPNMQGAMKGDLVKGIESLSGGVKFGANVILSGEATARSDQDASALVDVLKFFSTMAQSNGAKSGPMGMLDSLQMSSEGRVVKVSLTAPEQEFEKLFGPSMNRVKSKARSIALD